MPRHVFDDFSFLPTVDSTEEEIMEKKELAKAGPQPAAEEPQGEEIFEHPADYSDNQAQPRDFAPMDGGTDEVPTALMPPGPLEEPPSQDLSPEEQDGGALWQEFMRQDQSQPSPEEDLNPDWQNQLAAEPPAPVEMPAEPRVPRAAHKPPLEAPVPPVVHAKDEEAPAETRASQPPAEESEKPLPTPRAPEAVNLKVERGKGRRALVDTPPVSFRGMSSSRDKTDRKKETSAEVSAVAGAAGGHTSSGSEESSDPEAKPFIAPKPPSEEPLHPDQEKKVRWRKLVEKAGFQSLGWSVAAHLIILILAAFIGFNQVADKQVDFLPGGGSAQSKSAAAELTNKIQQKKNPWLKAKPRMQKVTVQTLAADVVLPEMQMDSLDLSSITNRMDIKAANLGGGGPMGMGTAGAGGGFGSGIGRGGKFSFVGQTALGKRVVFVVDVSGSMSAIGTGESISRFDLLKKELIKSINQMPMNTQYQILYFSDFAWPHDQVDSRDANALTKYRWEIDPQNYKKVKLPTFRFIQATPFSLRETADIIQRSDNPGGTNWGSGLLMALNASPKPDVIFFMTDGLRSDEQGWVDIVTAENKRRLPMSAIYTSAMQQPDAAKELDDLARRNNGRFTVVLGDGKIVKGEDFFKMKR